MNLSHCLEYLLNEDRETMSVQAEGELGNTAGLYIANDNCREEMSTKQRTSNISKVLL